MKIAFDLRRIKNPGIGRYMKCLVQAILSLEPHHDYLLILPPGEEDLVDIGSCPAKVIAPTLKYYSIREQIELPRILREHKVDLFHAPHFMLPLIRPCASVVTIHDVIGVAWKTDIPSLVGWIYYRGMISAAARLAKRIITVSKFSKMDIARRLGVVTEKITVVYPGIESNFQHVQDEAQQRSVRAKFRIDNEFIAYAGIYKPRKNHAALLRAFRDFQSNGARANLVLVGPLKEGEQVLRKLARELGIADKVIFTGFVNEAELRVLYSAARVYACPSLYEGFGITVPQAMACGTPVVCAPETSLPEVAGDAALYANPRDSKEFAQALYKAFSDADLRNVLIEKGRNNVKRFSWASAARETLGVYQEAFGIFSKDALVGSPARHNVA